jgi:hypothetical protein
VQASGQGALGGQVIFQRQDSQRGSQRVALLEQLPDPGGEGKLPARVAAAPASRPLRDDGARGVQGAGTPAGAPGAGRELFLEQPLTVSCSPRYIKSVSVIDLVTLPQVPGE